MLFAVSAREAAADKKKNKETPVTCGEVIDHPGDYFLSGNCTGTITIIASNVTLKLKGHTITSPSSDMGDGILAQNVSKVTISGPGTITDFRNGVQLTNVSNSVVEKVSAIENVFGISIDGGRRNKINENKANDNAMGIRDYNGSTGNKIEKNQCNDNDVYGILSEGPDNAFTRNECNTNANAGIVIRGSRNEIKKNECNNNGSIQGEGIVISDNSTDNEVEGNKTNNNVNFGIGVGFGATGNEIKENKANNNGIVGIGVYGTDNEIEENEANGNGTYDLYDDNPDCDYNEWDDNDFNTAYPECID